MSKMSKSGKYHTDVVFVAAVDGFLVAHRTSRLHNRSDACLVGQLDAVLEGEEGIRGQHSSLEVEVERTGLLDGLAQGIHARSLSNARGEELLAFGENDGIRTAMLHTSRCSCCTRSYNSAGLPTGTFHHAIRILRM